MRKSLFTLVLIALFNLAAAPTSAPSQSTPWQLLVQAADLPPTDSPRCSDISFREYPPYPKKWWDMAWDSEQQNTEQFRLLRQSRALMEDNGHHAGTPQIRITAPDYFQGYINLLSPLRNLANIVSDGATFSHLNGNDRETMQRLQDCWNIAQCVAQTHTLVSQLVGVGIEALDCANICGMARQLRMSDATNHQLVESIIHQLLDEEPARRNWRQTLTIELRDSVHGISKQGLIADLAFNPSAVSIDKDLRFMEKACQFSSESQSESDIKQCVWPMGLDMSLDRAIQTEFRVLGDRRMVASNLAIQLYRADHAGNWPSNLDALVPKYLPAVPRDPFRDDNAAVGYKIIPHGWPNGKDRPVVYVDEGPDFKLDSEPRVGWYNHGKEQVRQYRDLTLPKN